LVILMLVTGS